MLESLIIRLGLYQHYVRCLFISVLVWIRSAV